MNIVVNKNALPGVAGFVARMKSFGYSGRQLIVYKNTMLTFVYNTIQGMMLRRTINSVNACYYAIPNTYYRWVFTFAYYPKNQTTVIYGIELQSIVDDNEEVRKMVSLKERMESGEVHMWDQSQPVNRNQMYNTSEQQERNVVRLTEADLKRCVREVLSRMLTEALDFPSRKKQYQHE